MADFNILMQYIYERVYSFSLQNALQSVTFFRLFKVSCLRQTNLQDSNLLTIHIDFCSQKGLIKSVEHKLFPLVQHGWSLNCSKQSNCCTPKSKLQRSPFWTDVKPPKPHPEVVWWVSETSFSLTPINKKTGSGLKPVWTINKKFEKPS